MQWEEINDDELSPKREPESKNEGTADMASKLDGELNDHLESASRDVLRRLEKLGYTDDLPKEALGELALGTRSLVGLANSLIVMWLLAVLTDLERGGGTERAQFSAFMIDLTERAQRYRDGR